MLEILSLSQRDVKARLFARVESAPGLLLVTAVRSDRHMRPVPEREPFATLERRYGELVTQLLVVDEGSLEGMWRDPVGDLADRFFPQDREAAYRASNGYVLLKDGVVETVVRKAKPSEDLQALGEALAALHPDLPRPEPTPGDARGKRRRPTSPPSEERPRPLPDDPYTLLRLAKGTPRSQARKAFRALVAQYHPDKVAHLAPEFRTLAEERTRQLMAAWDAIEAELPD